MSKNNNNFDFYKIGERINHVRKEIGLSQEELANRSGINRSYLSMIENGHSSPTMEVVEKIANGLSVNITDLIENNSEKHYEIHWEGEIEMYEGLRDLLNSEDDMLLIEPSKEEIVMLKSIRFSGSFFPSKQFFIDALKDFRRSKRHHS